jgi:acetylornithine deacetylase/succinyl-diaminopimelate desuccinylase-like protein
VASQVILGKTRSNQPDAKTLLLYCFYDEVPVVPADWAVPPFPPSVVDPGTIGLPETYGEVLCGRGTIDHRGPLLAALQDLHAMQEAMVDLPVNIVYAIEGEEEIGSPNLSQFVHTYQDELREADAERAGGPGSRAPVRPRARSVTLRSYWRRSTRRRSSAAQDRAL